MTAHGPNTIGPQDDANPAAAEDDGIIGEPTDRTPNHHYTVAGVLAGEPTPETERSRCQVPQPCVDEDDWAS